MNYQTSEPVFFPFPGIELAEVTVSKNDDELIQVHKLRIEVYYGVFVGQALEIRKIYLNTGTVEIKREKDESFPLFERVLSKSEVNPEITAKNTEVVNLPETKYYFSKVFANFVNQIEIKNITILFEDKLYSRNIKLYLWETTFQLDRDLRNLDVYIYGKLNDEPISFSSNFYLLRMK